jgi:hypothetical protein
MVQKGFPLFITVDLEDLIAGLHEMHLLSGEKTFTIAQCAPDPYKFFLFFCAAKRWLFLSSLHSRRFEVTIHCCSSAYLSPSSCDPTIPLPLGMETAVCFVYTYSN